MNIWIWALVIYITLDLAASAYVVIKRGGIRATIADIRNNLGISSTDAAYDADEDDDDVHDRF